MDSRRLERKQRAHPRSIKKRKMRKNLTDRRRWYLIALTVLFGWGDGGWATARENGVALLRTHVQLAHSNKRVTLDETSSARPKLAKIRDREIKMNHERAKIHAPELAGGRGWLNTDKPLSLAALRGKVVLLDFWTYGCINCIHIIPDLKRLEAKYAKELVVIGVHSAKFENEKESENIRRIILRYEIEHPVVNDADFKIWQAYAVRAWPTRVLVDPAGYIVGRIEGEGSYSQLDDAIQKTINEFRKRGELKEEPLNLTLERAKVGDLPLAFPGKVLADAKQNRLFIADSNHNRIVVTKLDGALLETIGTGAAGKSDGDFRRAQFNRPQGMALDEKSDTLYVADTENHLIRRVDLRGRKVETIAGTGEQLRQFLSVEDGMTDAKTQAISSPWDVQLVGQNLYIAMAGVHQIWRLDLIGGKIGVFAGTGREARQDGERAEAAFAQPSGLASDGRFLYVADSESNIIRRVDLNSKSGEVVTLAGGDLFEFGDRDGIGDEARLQHPLGIVYADGALLIADTYNHKLKRLDLQLRAVTTFLGAGRAGQTDGKHPSFYEPGGLSVADGKLYVADQNNQAVRVVDLKTRRADTLMISNLTPPQFNAAKTDEAGETAKNAPNIEEMKLSPQTLPLGENTLIVDVALPANYHLNPSAPQRLNLQSENDSLAAKSLEEARADLRAGRLPLRVPVSALKPGKNELNLRLTLFYCRQDNTGTCRIKTLLWRIPVEITSAANAPRALSVKATINDSE
jgi:DNA-binding beta-propeller fold protein YncE